MNAEPTGSRGTNLFVVCCDNECTSIAAGVGAGRRGNRKLPVLMPKTLFSRHFSGPEAETQTIKSCFPSTRSSVESLLQQFRHLITNRFQLLGERKLRKKTSKETPADKYPSIEQNHQNGHSRPQKMCFQFTANDFRLFLLRFPMPESPFCVCWINLFRRPTGRGGHWAKLFAPKFCSCSMQIPTIPGIVFAHSATSVRSAFAILESIWQTFPPNVSLFLCLI